LSEKVELVEVCVFGTMKFNLHKADIPAWLKGENK
jgi:hypothetical protein